MDVVATSLEALIQRATNPLNEKPDVAAMEAFCVTLGKESRGIDVASRLLATHVQSSSEKEALQALTLLDTCMKRCGRSFRSEIGKFRFLNTMIKLVSPKYLGDETADAVRVKILDLLYAWTRDYPREAKIRETYEMLKRQGVVKEKPERPSPTTSVAEIDVDADAPTALATKSTKLKNPIFEDEEKTKLLQELLQSKDPFDLKLANRLIKSMVKEDEKRVQVNSQRNMQLESVSNNVKLLSEMLDSYEAGNSSAEDVELMKELCDACERLKPTLSRLASETRDNDAEMLGEVLSASDQLTQVIEKYASVVVLGRCGSKASTIPASSLPSLLDLSSPSDATDTTAALTSRNKTGSAEHPSNDSRSNIEMLGDIFNSIGNPLEQFPSASTPIDSSPLVLPDANIMQPISVIPTTRAPASRPGLATTVKLDSKAKALEDLNQLGEWLLKQSLSKSNNDTTSTNLVNASKMTNETDTRRATELSIVDVTRNKDESANGLVDKPSSLVNGPTVDFVDLLNDDDAMLDASSSSVEKKDKNVIEDAKSLAAVPPSRSNSTSSSSAGVCNNSKNVEIKPLTDIRVTLDDIEPGPTPPLTVIKEKNGISVVLHFAKGSPRPDVSVIVVTTSSKNTKAVTDYLVQAVVSENCKCRLEGPSDTRLPAHNPFLPPAAITQIMLIANPRKIRPSLKLMLSYTMENETFTEMGEVDEMPLV